MQTFRLRALARYQGISWLREVLPPSEQQVFSSMPHGGLNGYVAHVSGQQLEQSIPSAAGQPAPVTTQASLLSEVEALNAELFSVLGQPQSDSQEATPASVAQQSAEYVDSNVRRHGTGALWPGLGRVAISSSSMRGVGGPMQHDVSSSESAARSSVDSRQGLTHVDASGRAAMVDVSQKPATVRTASAGARVVLGPAVYELVANNQLDKGDVLTVAQLAGVMGAKHTSMLIPLCHNILLSKVHVTLALEPAASAVEVTATATTVGPTGVEMEALTAAAVAALTVYDMCKAASKSITITDLRLLAKSGGRSGEWHRA